MSARQRGRGRGDRRRPRNRAAQGDSLVGQRLTLDIEDVAQGGHCVARHDGRVVFVRHSLPGERVVAEVTDGGTGSRFLRADAVEILTASPERRPSPCVYAGPGLCGGCDWQHTSARFGRELKTRVVREQLQRLAGIEWDGEVEAVPGDEEGQRWRTRVEFAATPRGRIGLRRHRSHDVVPVDDCLITVPEIAATGLLGEVVETGVTGVDVAVDSAGEVVAIDLPIRRSSSGGGSAAEDAAHRDPVPNVTETVHVAGRGDRDFAVSARGFWQVHPGAASTFVTEVLDRLRPQPGERVLDLYSGVGVFTAFLADAVGTDGRVLGLEGDARAVQDGQGNLAGLPQASLQRADIGRDGWQSAIDDGLDTVDLVVLDPPRTGAGREVIGEITARQPRAIAYVACDPAALARDLSYAADAGYGVTSLRAFDAFPMTHHVECIAILSRVGES
ncbi:class I SAM-dependent RNA methyltransferase [Flexivirga sp. ID2601S]|uniref:Class I SAM-dependent RNA methyltransferase n=1 Tax=Flexivirga aerilata TaxID=1656889 RepID=A0A849AKT2_9MICO|nr:class I SAM-dependent RNA methyltransferase [Flexivirga aerilata]NNG39888.1 class I SAM-dependent RNA methyltransferase [Flexivirga aerilata]